MKQRLFLLAAALLMSWQTFAETYYGTCLFCLQFDL